MKKRKQQKQTQCFETRTTQRVKSKKQMAANFKGMLNKLLSRLSLSFFMYFFLFWQPLSFSTISGAGQPSNAVKLIHYLQNINLNRFFLSLVNQIGLVNSTLHWQRFVQPQSFRIFSLAFFALFWHLLFNNCR